MNNENFEVDDQLLLKVINNEADENELMFFSDWLEASDSNKKQFEEFKYIWGTLERFSVPKEPDTKIQWRAMDFSLFKNTDVFRSKNIWYKKRRKAEVLSWMLRAAVIVIMFTTTYVLFKDTGYAPVEKKSNKVEYYTFTTKRGEKKTLNLSDGSVIYLNVASSLRSPSVFSEKMRRVFLQGEAYFDIAEDKQRPFKIISNNSTVEVTGTEFNINNRNGGFEVVVAEGSVKTYMRGSKETLNLKVGDKVSYNAEDNKLELSHVNVNDYTAWRKNSLVFRNTKLAKVLLQLEIYFNVKAEVLNDNIYDKSLTGSFDASSLDDVLTAISVSLNVDIKRTANTIRFY